jgi:predicted transposase YbfD/YdcC
MRALDPALFKACFASWVEGLREAEPDIVAIDGKTARRTHARRRGREPLHLVSAWASRQRLVLGQEAVPGQANEITAIPLLLERLALTGALVTIDAIGCQTDIAQAIVDKDADYLFAVKGNWPALSQEIALYFREAPAARIDRLDTVDGDHGRIELRRHYVSHEVDWLNGTRRSPDERRFPKLTTLAMVETEVERDGKTARERRYYLSSAPLDAKLFARAVRAHWHIENRLHWVLDVVFHDDLARLRTGHGPENMAVVKHMAMNLLRDARPSTSLKNRRKLAGWNLDYLDALIRGKT